MSSNKFVQYARRPVVAVVTGAVVVTGAAVILAQPSTLASAGQAVPSVAPSADPSAVAAALTPEQLKAQTIATYGIYPLPVPETAIATYKLTNKDLAQIAEAKKLAATPHVQSIRECESSNDYQSQDRQYYGAYQFLTSTWLANGGGRFAPRADKAAPWMQDYIMYRTYKADGWGQWACA